jgi:tRNA pseudouridine55 synthase
LTSSGLILSVHKPLGCTSFDVVATIRRRLGWKSVGHAGTLDPAATGVLLILCGDATARTEEFMDLPKEYRARIHFGFSTSTDDFEGDVIESHTVTDWNSEILRSEVESLEHVTTQSPPAVSALKVGGRRAYRVTRAGNKTDLASRHVRIYSASLLSERQPEIDVLIRCSRGTYIRSIARDMGQKLGWGGTLAALVRTAVGPYRVECALPLSDVITRSTEFSAH